MSRVRIQGIERSLLLGKESVTRVRIQGIERSLLLGKESVTKFSNQYETLNEGNCDSESIRSLWEEWMKLSLAGAIKGYLAKARQGEVRQRVCCPEYCES